MFRRAKNWVKFMVTLAPRIAADEQLLRLLTRAVEDLDARMREFETSPHSVPDSPQKHD